MCRPAMHDSRSPLQSGKSGVGWYNQCLFLYPSQICCMLGGLQENANATMRRVAHTWPHQNCCGHQDDPPSLIAHRCATQHPTHPPPVASCAMHSMSARFYHQPLYHEVRFQFSRPEIDLSEYQMCILHPGLSWRLVASFFSYKCRIRGTLA